MEIEGTPVAFTVKFLWLCATTGRLLNQIKLNKNRSLGKLHKMIYIAKNTGIKKEIFKSMKLLFKFQRTLIGVELDERHFYIVQGVWMADILASHGGNSIVSRNHDCTRQRQALLVTTSFWLWMNEGQRSERSNLYTLLWISCNIM